MEALTKMYIILAVMAVSVIIYLMGPAVMSALADEAPGYVAQSIAFTIDAVAGAPENTYVEYNIPQDKVSFVLFKDSKVQVSRYDMCDYGWKLIKQAVLGGIGLIWETAKDIGRYLGGLVGWGVASPPGITGAFSVKQAGSEVGKSFEVDVKMDEIAAQMRTKDYHKTDTIRYDFEDQGSLSARPGEDGQSLKCVATLGRETVNEQFKRIVWPDGELIKCDALLEAIFDDPFYYSPSVMLFEKIYNTDKKSDVWVNARC